VAPDDIPVESRLEVHEVRTHLLARERGRHDVTDEGRVVARPFDRRSEVHRQGGDVERSHHAPILPHAIGHEFRPQGRRTWAGCVR
jgi:hypothetical protein